MSMAFAFLMGLLVCMQATAIQPESGMYWDPSAPGRGYYIEAQDGTIWFMAFAYDEETGKPKIFVANGPLRDDAVEMGFHLAISPPPFPIGFYPLHWFQGDLFSVEGGACLPCPQGEQAFVTERVGRIFVWFPDVRWAFIDMLIDEDDDIPVQRFVERFNFGRERITFDGGQIRFHDLRGEWVFVDQGDAELAPSRFLFDHREPAELSSAPQGEIVYRDSTRGAEFRCIDEPPGQATRAQGCELHMDGEVMFSARNADIGLDRIQAFRGPLPPTAAPSFSFSNPYRGPDPVIGLRVQFPP
jgi:hypothetical protein